MGNVLLSLITFLAAFLLFQIELIIAKIFLPNYGGSYLVWGACLVFFQAILLLGYWFAHAMTTRLGIEKYRLIHLGLLAATLLFFPGKNLQIIFGQTSLPLVADIFLRLALNIGLVFFVLSTMSLVTQVWLSGSKLPARFNPYFLYAVSNLGSFAALLTYPFVFELLLDVHQQLLIWRIGYFVLIGLNVLAFFQVPLDLQSLKVKEGGLADPTLTRRTRLRWLLLGAGASMMFMSVSNLITYELPPVPLFWIFPLSIYLLSFVLNFKKDPWCPHWVANRIQVIIGLSALYYFFIQKLLLPTLLEFSILLGLLFLLCMYCQRELVRSKPLREEDLTGFYFIISLGSFLGGMFTTWVVPLVSSSMVEYMWSLIVISLTVRHDPAKPLLSPYTIRLVIYLNIFLTLWAGYFIHYNFLGVALLFVTVSYLFKELAGSRHGVTLVLLILLAGVASHEAMWDKKVTQQTWKLRNYYGLHSVVDSDNTRWLYHGSTLHGAQSLSPQDALTPLTYYGPKAAVSQIMRSDFLHFTNVAFIGLGTGTATVYLKESQRLDIYELDPDIYKIAIEKFSFLPRCLAPWRIFLGDARLSMDKVHDRVYDLILIDAFGGDAIPVHLLTKEVMGQYRSRLAPDGIILIHISNRYVKLGPVLGRVARDMGAKLCRTFSKGQGLYTSSEWMILTWDEKVFSKILSSYNNWQEVSSEEYRNIRAWTDQYSSIIPVIRIEFLLDALKNFKPFYW